MNGRLDGFSLSHLTKIQVWPRIASANVLRRTRRSHRRPGLLRFYLEAVLLRKRRALQLAVAGRILIALAEAGHDQCLFDRGIVALGQCFGSAVSVLQVSVLLVGI